MRGRRLSLFRFWSCLPFWRCWTLWGRFALRFRSWTQRCSLALRWLRRGTTLFWLRSRLALFRLRSCLPFRHCKTLWGRFVLRFRRWALRCNRALFRLRSCATLFRLRSCLELRRGLICLPGLWFRGRVALVRLRSCLALRLWSCLTLPRLRSCLMLLLHLPIGRTQRGWSCHVVVGRERLIDGRIRRSAMICGGKLRAVCAGRALVLDLCTHRRGMLLPHGDPLRGLRRSMDSS